MLNNYALKDSAFAVFIAFGLPGYVQDPSEDPEELANEEEENQEESARTCDRSDPIEPEAFICTTKCAIVGDNIECTGWVVGEGFDKTVSLACKAAKQNANDNVQRLLPDKGCQAKHCRPCDCHKR